MKYLRATCVLLALSLPVFAGDIDSPGYTPPPPPPCTENCMVMEQGAPQLTTATDSGTTTSEVMAWGIMNLLSLIF